MQYVIVWGVLLEQVQLVVGDFVIIIVVSSSVGLVVIQIVNVVGVMLIVVICGLCKCQVLFDVGVVYVIVIQEQDLVVEVVCIIGGVGVCVVFDLIGGLQFVLLIEVMVYGGILLEYGVLSSEFILFLLFNVLGKLLMLKGYLYFEIVFDDVVLVCVKVFIVDGLDKGMLVLKIVKVFFFVQIQDVYCYLELNEQIGKVVVML